MTQAPDPRPGNYYVSVIDGKRIALLYGPCSTHEEALGMVNTVQHIACDLDPRGVWYAYGTCRLHDGEPAPLGRLNEQCKAIVSK